MSARKSGFIFSEKTNGNSNIHNNNTGSSWPVLCADDFGGEGMTYTPKKEWQLGHKSVTTIDIAAEIVGCDRRQIYRYMEDGRIRWVWVEENHRLRKKWIYRPDCIKMRKEREKRLT